MTVQDEEKYFHTILGHSCGVGFSDRGDGHILVTFLTEDDEYYFPSHNKPFSSYWIPDKIAMLQQAHVYLENNHKRDPSGYGYVKG